MDQGGTDTAAASIRPRPATTRSARFLPVARAGRLSSSAPVPPSPPCSIATRTRPSSRCATPASWKPPSTSRSGWVPQAIGFPSPHSTPASPTGATIAKTADTATGRSSHLTTPDTSPRRPSRPNHPATPYPACRPYPTDVTHPALNSRIAGRTDGRRGGAGSAGRRVRESAKWRADLLRGCRPRGMTAPALAVGDGPLGFCKPLRETFPEITTQRYVAQDRQCARSAARSRRNRAPRPRSPSTRTPKTPTRGHRCRGPSPPTTAPSGPRRSGRSPMTSTCCWRSGDATTGIADGWPSAISLSWAGKDQLQALVPCLG